MRLNKVIGAYLSDLGESIATSAEPICPMLLSELLPLLAKMEARKSESKADDKQGIKKEEMTPEECLACELMNMLGLSGDVLGKPGEHVSESKPTIKIKIKKISSSDDLDKILKEMKSGGVIDLNSANDSLGEIFDLNSIQLIMETPMFKLGGTVEEQNDTTLESFLNEDTDSTVQ